jgi:DNA modification methylase
MIVNADARFIPLADESVNCVVTSPPYYGLRDYGISGQIGLEVTPDEYVANLVQVFREVKRVLRDDGTLWLNLGDSYSGSGKGQWNGGASDPKNQKTFGMKLNNVGNIPDGLKPKDLIGIPWMVAFALRADGWWLRQDIIWAKPNPMPESVTDRCTKAHEYVFLLTKSARYWYDNDAIREPQSVESLNRLKRGYNGDVMRDYPSGAQNHLKNYFGETDEEIESLAGRNKRSVWTVTTRPYKGAHFATFPPDLIKPMILAGCPQIVCAKCGAPYQRVLERVDKRHWTERNDYRSGDKYKFEYLESKQRNEIGRNDAPASFKSPEMIDKGFQPTCNCNAGTTSGIVFDPFVGSGTTVMVANELGRRGIGLDLNMKYLDVNARERLASVQPLIFA